MPTVVCSKHTAMAGFVVKLSLRTLHTICYISVLMAAPLPFAVMLDLLMMLMTHTNLAALCTSNLVNHHPQCRCSYSHQPVAEEARSPLLSDLH